MPNESWMEYLNQFGVLTENRVEKCHACGHDVGTVQMWELTGTGEKVARYKLCTSCHHEWKKPSSWMIKQAAKRRNERRRKA